MMTWKCPAKDCNYSMMIGMSIGTPTCPEHDVGLISLGSTSRGINITNNGDLHTAAKVIIGGSVSNTGKIKVYENGELNISKDLINSGDLIINDPEKIKEMLVETIKTVKSVSELGTEILKKFFGI